MDQTKRTSNKFLRYILLIIIAGVIISHFFKNHTQTQPQKVAVQKIIPLPTDIAPHMNRDTAPMTSATKVITTATRFKSSVIYHSLYAAERNAGLTEKMDQQLNAMFRTSGISHDIRPGDHLDVLYHEYFLNDHRYHPGNILAAEITQGKKQYRIVRFTTPNDHTGYYKPNGEGTKPLFLKAPLHYVRIGSRFNYHRFDPILHKVEPHLGVDFDAPMGTPVKAISNGIVLFRKQMRGYGNVVMVQYNRTYKSFYAHLEKFARHLRPYEHVKRGQVIGYVGTTGWTTGPHLHFAIYKNGVAVNPLTVHFPHGLPVPEKYRREFFYKEDHWFDEMKLFENAQLASK